jgi:hypothetical protein
MTYHMTSAGNKARANLVFADDLTVLLTAAIVLIGLVAMVASIDFSGGTAVTDIMQAPARALP